MQLIRKPKCSYQYHFEAFLRFTILQLYVNMIFWMLRPLHKSHKLCPAKVW